MSVTKAILLALAILVVSSICCTASVPTIISYQGKLIQPSGEPFVDGTYTITFSIYDVPNGGTAVWTETNRPVQLKGGLFSVLLGSVTPIQPTVFSAPDRWFGITVGTTTEMLPRQKIASVAYAHVAATSQTVEVGAVTEEMLAPGIATPTGTVSMFAGVTAPQGWLLCQGQAVSRTTYAALFAAIGIAYGAGDGTTTFNLPDLQSRFPIGKSSTYALGSKGGSSTKNLSHVHMTNDHTLTIPQMPSHTHGPGGSATMFAGFASGGSVSYGTDGGYLSEKFTATDPAGGDANHVTQPHNHGNTDAGGSTTQDVMNPYVAINYIIKL